MFIYRLISCRQKHFKLIHIHILHDQIQIQSILTQGICCSSTVHSQLLLSFSLRLVISSALSLTGRSMAGVNSETHNCA